MLQVKDRTNGHSPISLNGPQVEAPPRAPENRPVRARAADEFLATLGTSAVTGVNWRAVMEEVIYPDDPYKVDLMFRWGTVGRLEDCLPSGKWYSLGHVGKAGYITVAEVRADLDWLEAVEREAAALGLELGIPDDIAEHITASITARLALEWPGGVLVWEKKEHEE